MALQYGDKLKLMYRLEKYRNEWQIAGEKLQELEDELEMYRQKRQQAAGQNLTGMPRSGTIRDNLAEYAIRVLELEEKTEIQRNVVRKKYIRVIVEESRLYNAVKNSPDAELLLARFMLGKSYYSISQTFKTPETTIRRRIKKAIENLSDEDMKTFKRN